MLLLLSFLELSFFFLSNVAALNITVQSNTIVGQPSLVLWERKLSDGNGPLVFDLRIVKPKSDSDNEDFGLALANIQAPPSVEFGTTQVVFRSPGSYLLVAVSGPDNTRIGQSGQVNAFQVPTTSESIPAPSISQPVLSATTSDTLESTATGASQINLGGIIGGTLGGVAFLGLLAALGIVLLRRQSPENRRWTFYPDKMIRPPSPVLDIGQFSTRQMPMPTSRRMSGSSMDSRFSSLEDTEQQGLPHDDILSTFPIVMMASPTRPIMAYPRPRPLPERPEPLRPLPPQPDQENIVVHMEQIRNQMKRLERNSQIILNDLQR